MPTSFFFGKQSNFIQSSSKLYNNVNKNINNIGTFNIQSKYYSFLNKKNLNSLKNYKFFILLKSFGKNYILFLTKIEEKNYCIFINKKNNVMNIVNIDFDDSLFNGSLFDGEIVKNEDNKYIFLINDIPYYKGKSQITKNFEERNILISEILEKEYRPDNELFITKKVYFNINEINDLVDNFSKVLSYRCSGLLFKNNTNFGDNYLFSFPECRSDSKILKNGITIDNQKVIVNEEHKIISPKNSKNDLTLLNDDSDLFGDIENVNDNTEINKKTCDFMINATELPDIYELYCYSSNNNIEKYSYASVPDIKTSNYLKSIINFDNITENVLTKIKKNNATFVECCYHKNFKKWVPIKETKNMDNITIINQVQITLDAQ
jgi:hypothetical protein